MKMKPLTLSKIAEVTGGRLVGGDPGTEVSGVVRDSREAKQGSLFVCIPGERVDGHNFAAKAAEAGAVCCLAEHDIEADVPYILVESTLKALRELAAYYRTLFDIPVIGIVGSVGKTTAKEMTAAVLSQKFRVLKTEENLNNEIGVPLTLLSLRQEHEAAVIEMGISDFGEMSRLAEMVRPDICIMTVIGYCHLETLGDLNGVLKAKSEVFEYMPESGIAIVNGDDELLAACDPGIRKVTFGLGEDNDYRAEDVVSQGFGGVTCRIVQGDRSVPVAINGLGSHLVQAALAAAAAGSCLGMEDSDIAAGIASYTTIGGRANVIDTGYIKIIDDCYNANPNSMTASVLSLASLPGQRVAILGDMKELGSQERDLHRELGVLVGKCGIEKLVCCGHIAEFIYKGLISSGADSQAWYFPMKEAMFSVLPSLIQEGDTVLVKASHSLKFEEIVEELKKLR